MLFLGLAELDVGLVIWTDFRRRCPSEFLLVSGSIGHHAAIVFQLRVRLRQYSSRQLIERMLHPRDSLRRFRCENAVFSCIIRQFLHVESDRYRGCGRHSQLRMKASIFIVFSFVLTLIRLQCFLHLRLLCRCYCVLCTTFIFNFPSSCYFLQPVRSYAIRLCRPQSTGIKKCLVDHA